MNKKFVKILTAASTATLLGACAVQQPCPVVETAPVAPTTTNETVAGNESAQPAAQQATQPAAQQAALPYDVQPITQQPAVHSSAQTESSSVQGTTTQPSALQAASSSSVAAASSSSVTQQTQQPTEQPAEQPAEKPTMVPVDPYQALPNIVNDIFTYADTLFKQGNVDGAVAYLQRFRILKPLWSEWGNRADSLLNVFGMTNAERAKQYEPMILEIKNMNRVQAAYSLVAEVADSLIALAPGDSLTNFANDQKRIAYKNTLGKALKEKAQILELAEAKARFDEALKQANEFKMRYRDFENDLQIENLIAYIQRLQTSINSEDQKYWEKNDPAKALAEVDTLIEKKSYDKAKVLVERLKASKLRQQAAEKYQKLADAVCTDKRKTASQLYSQSTKQKKPEKKKELILKAIGALNTCNDEYPEYEKIKTVTDNINFLKKELER